jgi:hypothetical protein
MHHAWQAFLYVGRDLPGSVEQHGEIHGPDVLGQ